MTKSTLNLPLALVMSSIPLMIFPQTKEPDVKKNITEWGTISEGFQLALQTEKKIFSSGEPVWLTFYLKNTSNKSASAFSSVPWMDYIVDVRTEKGESVSLTEEAKVLEQKPKDEMIMGFRDMRLLSGQMLSERLLLNKQYSLSNRGTYSVVVRRKIPKRGLKGWAEVTSNTVRITIGN